MSTIAILGSGIVGQTLAAGLREVGHDVTIGSRNGKAVEGWDGAVGTFTEAFAGATVAVLAVKGTVAQEVVESLAGDLADVVVLATGVTPRIPDVEGVDHPKVVTYLDVLRHHVPVGARVAVMGAGGIGFDIAEYLTQNGPSGAADPAVRERVRSICQGRS